MSPIDPNNYRAVGLAAIAVAEHRGAVLVGTGVADPLFQEVLPPIPCVHGLADHQDQVYSADDAEEICAMMTQGQMMFVAGKNAIGLVESPEGEGLYLGYDSLECKPTWEEYPKWFFKSGSKSPYWAERESQ